MVDNNTNTVINTNTVHMTEKQKVKEITDRLEEGLKELFESEKYKSYLSTMSKFHNYSFNNTLLIAMQKPEATLVAGYKAWQKNFGRHVNKGEKAIRILAPMPYKIKEERDKLDPVTGEMTFDENGMPQKEEVEVTIPAFRVVSVFDVSQTDGKPIPELEAQELLSAVEGYENFVQALMNVAPVPIGFEDIPGDSKGYFHTTENRIAVQENMSESQTLKTMVHETAHSMLHNKEISQDIDAPVKDRNTKEVEAESIAYTVCQHFGIDTSDYSFGYIAGWSSGKDMKELKSSLDTIRRTSSELIKGIEGQLQEIQRDRDLMQDKSINGLEKESRLLIQNSDLSEYSLVNVRGMDAAEIMEALSAMNDDDRLSVAAYLESRGAWTTEIANEETREFGEYHLDVRYITDTNEIIDLKKEMAWEERAKEPIGADDVILKITHAEGFEIERITNKTPEEVQEIMGALTKLEEKDRKNIHDCLESYGADYIPIIVDGGRNSGMPQFNDFEIDLNKKEVVMMNHLSPAQQAEGIINRLEYAKTAFSDDERNLIVNYAYKLNDMEKTRELAEHIYYEETEGNQGAALAVIDAQAEIDALPDPMIGLSEMEDYGYTWNEMLPLTKERALELFEHDLPIYVLHEDGSEPTVEDRTQITEHEGIFGIEKKDWENERNFLTMQEELSENEAAKETRLLYGSTDKYGIYQLKDDPELRQFRFEGTEALKRMGITKYNFDAIKRENYNLIYVGELSELQGQTQGETLEAVFEKFNIDHPTDYKGHSLSVSDIVVLHEDGENTAHFVDSFGFTELPEFTRTLEGEKTQEADKAEMELTDEEKQFLETDNAPLIAKKFLAWDEIEDLGYRFFEDGYIDRFEPSEKALYGDGMVPEPEIYDIARRMHGGEDIRKELAKALIGGYERVMGIGEDDAVAVFGNDAVTVTFGNAKKQISYEEMGTAFLGLIEREYKDVEQARATEEQEEEIAEDATFGQSVQKPETESIEDGDEIIDLGEEREQVLAEMKKAQGERQDTSGHDVQKPGMEDKEEPHETELAFQIADRYITIQETEGGYDYSIMGMDYKEIDGGVYDNPDISIREALNDIVEDLKAEPDHNGAKGNIEKDSKLIPMDFDELLVKNMYADRVEGSTITNMQNTQSSVVADFKAKTDELFHEISEMNPAEIEETVKVHVQAKIDEYGIDAQIVDAAVVGSRCRGLEREGSDLDVVVELSTNEREDDLFNTFNEDGLHIGGIKVDINPITEQRTGSLETYLPQVEEYLEGIRMAREQAEKEVEVTLMVSECSEFHNYGEFYENISTVEEAIAIWKQIPPERLNAIPAIGINVHLPGTEPYEDSEIDILSGRRIDLEILEHIPDIKNNPKAMEVIAQLVAKLPEMEIDGVMSEEMEARVWELRMPGLDKAGQLAVELDRFVYDYDIYSYRNDVHSMTENIAELTEMLNQGDTEHITEWLNEAISEGAAPEEEERAKELLEKLAEYTPLAKIEENAINGMEEQNYNMVDDVQGTGDSSFNNGVGEKAQKEAAKREQEQPAARISLKARLAEKKAQVAGQNQDHDAQENSKNNQREM